LDEFVGYSAAVVGVIWQMRRDFGLPFPLSFIMFPFTFAEWWIRWTLASDGTF